jgi:RNA polymerase sigma factor (sigma-70 family)
MDDTLTAETLMAAYAAGDEGAFQLLFTRLAPSIHAFFVQSFRDPLVADDLTQQTFLKLHAARKRYRAGSPVRPWIFTIAVRVRLDEHRRRYRRLRVVSEVELEAIEDQAGGPALPDPGERADLHAQVRAAIARLPETQRVVVYLHRYEGLSFAEVAAILGLSEGAVKQRASRAYAQLRAELLPLVAREEVA